MRERITELSNRQGLRPTTERELHSPTEPHRTGPAPTAGDPTESHRTGHVPTTTDPAVTGTGTTVVALAADGAAVLAADRRASVGRGRFVASKDVRKVEQVHPTAAAALSGSVGGLQSFVRALRTETDRYATERDRDIGLSALATYAGGLLREGPFRAVQPLLAGVDDDGPAVFDLDPGGAVMAADYAAKGSGMQVAYGVLEGGYGPDLPVDAARAVAADAVAAASERDTASGNGLTVTTVTSEGVATEAYDEAAAVAGAGSDGAGDESETAEEGA